MRDMMRRLNNVYSRVTDDQLITCHIADWSSAAAAAVAQKVIENAHLSYRES